MLNKTELKQSIRALLTDMRERTEVSDDEFAERMAGIIDAYIKSATVTVPSGIPVSTAGSATSQTGATTVTATAKIS